MTDRDFVEELIVVLRREIMSWRKTGTIAIADRIEQVIRDFYVARGKK